MNSGVTVGGPRAKPRWRLWFDLSSADTHYVYEDMCAHIRTDCNPVATPHQSSKGHMQSHGPIAPLRWRGQTRNTHARPTSRMHSAPSVPVTYSRDSLYGSHDPIYSHLSIPIQPYNAVLYHSTRIYHVAPCTWYHVQPRTMYRYQRSTRPRRAVANFCTPRARTRCQLPGIANFCTPRALTRCQLPGRRSRECNAGVDPLSSLSLSVPRRMLWNNGMTP